MKAVWIVFLFLKIFSMLLLSVVSIEESFCFGVGYDDNTKKGLGLITMGASSIYAHPLNIFWAANHCPSSLSRSDKPTLIVTRVHGPAADGSSKELNGWLKLEISRSSGRISAIAIWALTDKMETFGQFMTPTTSDCSLWKMTNLPFVPCSGTPVDAAYNPNMFVLTSITGSAVRTVKLLWRADTAYCNMPKEFMFVLALTGDKWARYSSVKAFSVFEGGTKEYGPTLYRSAILTPRFYGPSSPIFDKTALKCDSTTTVTSNSDEVSNVQAQWLRSIAPTVNVQSLDPKYYNDRWLAGSKDQPNVVIPRSVCKAQDKGFVDFGGRCTEKNWDEIQAGRRVWASLGSPPKCVNIPGNIETIEIMDKFEHVGLTGGKTPVHLKDYVKGQRKDEVHKKPCPCPPIPTSADVVTVASRKARQVVVWLDANPYLEPERGCKEYSGKPEYHKHGLCLLSAAGQYSLGVRQWHAVTNLLCTMFFIPISSFMARYLKGHIPIVHLTGQPSIPTRSWYLTHIILVLPAISMYASGISSINRQLAILGNSRAAYAAFHRVSGYVVIGLFGFQCIFGFLRPLKMLPRKICIYVHWGVGYFIQYFGAILCILTYRIPASPFSFHKLLDPKFKSVYYHISPFIVIVWLICDLFYHLGVTLYIRAFEKTRLNVSGATYFPVIMPMRVDSYYLRTRAYDDLPHEDHCLGKLFIGYCVFSGLFFTFTILSMSYLNFEQHHGYGPMDCTHNAKNIFTAGSDNVSDADLKAQHQFCSI